MFKKICIISFLFFSASVLAGEKWGYLGNNGPAHWGQLSHDFIFCSVGKLQSPINIPKKIPVIKQTLNFNYQQAALDTIINGETKISIGKQSIELKDPGLQVNFPLLTQESITFNEEKYRLLQFHFHSPSETRLRGQAYPLEIHFVHQGDSGKLLVVAVFVKGGEANKTLQELIDNLPKTSGKELIDENEKINPTNLLPTSHQYYYFDGSLTTPPCTEGVMWVVLETPITASPYQIAIIRKTIGGENARPIQPLHNRSIGYVK